MVQPFDAIQPIGAGSVWFEWDDGPNGLGAEYQLEVEVRARPSVALPSPASRVVDPQEIASIARARVFQWRPIRSPP